ncbi:MAG: exonuclease SbcCD subunit D C-terminal domain-containing protein [Candidatus Marinimicrobia bacterium]|nr:exonuclease SbcCD subunit D C-terminal domain-containing protein [Candidatus Neomarinimicrobiota bacterium]
MKILHTSDWHLGRSLYGRKRYDEFSAFLDWLSATIESEHIDALLIAGDVFDTSTPSNLAQNLYYRFLSKVSNSCCQHIVVIAGNHDSPSFLNAPKELLRALSVYVVGEGSENPEDEVIVLQDKHDLPKAIVCAAPYLRDKDIRTVESGETFEDKNAKLALGLKKHYADVCDLAEQKQSDFLDSDHLDVPIIAMGHLFTSGGKTMDGDGVRDLYIGNLAHLGTDAFPASIDYLALGHLHIPQRVGKTEHIRYSGSPIPMGYGEAKQTKQVIVVEFDGKTPTIHDIKVPCFQPLERIVGSLDEIHSRIEQLKQAGSNAWLEIEYTGSDLIGNLRETFETALANSELEIRRIKNQRMFKKVLNATKQNETLDDLNEQDVFERCLDTFDILVEDRKELISSYNEIIMSLQEEDKNAE